MKHLRPTNETPERLDKVLIPELGHSRSKIQKAIEAGAVLVDNNKVTSKFPVTAENEIQIDESFFVIPEITSPPPVLDVVYEDNDVMVINKPAGLLVHKTQTSNERTLVDGLLALHPEMKTVGDSEDRPGIVHRLDRQASGLLIVAKTQEAFEHLKQQFRERSVQKIYVVLVHGKMTELVGTINLPISRAKNSGKMAARPTSQEGKEAITHYEVIEQFPHHALLKVRIETGRTHQIRAHFYAIEHPVAGDTIYKQKTLKGMDLGRVFLHATELSLTLPSGEEKTFRSALPAELEQTLKDIPKI